MSAVCLSIRSRVCHLSCLLLVVSMFCLSINCHRSFLSDLCKENNYFKTVSLNTCRLLLLLWTNLENILLILIFADLELPQNCAKIGQRKNFPFYGIQKNKDADQLCSNREADQRLCFHHIDSTIPLLSEPKISKLQPSSVSVQPGLCRTRLETRTLVFS